MPELENSTMANPGTASAGHPDMDYAEHERTYEAFVTIGKWVTISLIILMILMAWFLV
jgi:hypothetical protein